MVNYTRRDFLKAIGVGAASVMLPGCDNGFSLLEGKASGARPNIVLIMADDMGFSDIGCYGGEISTPNLDRLAAGGLRFTQFYNAARCCPTRASLLTGLYPHQAGIGHMSYDNGLEGYRGVLSKQCVTIAEVLKQAGYATYISGKWHLCHFDFKTRTSDASYSWPIQRGFDEFYGTLAGAGSFYNPPGLMRNNTPVKPDSDDYYYTDAISDNAARFVTGHVTKNADTPFFLYVSYTAPHWPLHAPQESIAKYKGRYDNGWDALRADRHKRMIKMGIVKDKWKITPRDKKIPSWKKAKNKKWQARRMEVYAAQVDLMDQGIGRIVTALKKTGQIDNTLILFLSDNGGCASELDPKNKFYRTSGIIDRTSPDGKPVRFGNNASIMPGAGDTFASYGRAWANAGNTPFREYKCWVHEGGIATPLIAHWPAVIKQRGKLTDQAGHIIDIMATCVDAAGGKYPAQYKSNKIRLTEGQTLVPEFVGGKMSERAIYWEHEGNRAVRKGKWKLVSKYPVRWDQISKDQGRWELYDTEADRTELNDLADKYPEIVKELATMYNAWTKRNFVMPWHEILNRR